MNKSVKKGGNKAEEKDKRKKIAWKEKDEIILIELWEGRINEIRGNRRNSHIYEDMSRDLQSYGCTYTAHEIKTKLHNLTNRYRKEKDAIGPSGGSPSSWNLYERIHCILGSFKINNVEHLVYESIEGKEESSGYENVEILDDDDDDDDDYCDDMSQSSTSTSTPAAPKKKRRKLNLQEELFNKIDHIDESISQQANEIRERDEKLYNLELRKTDLIETFVKSTDKMKNAFIQFLNK